MALHPDASKQTRWLDLVRRWQRSQLTVRQFCQRHQLSEASFYSWRRVLHERGLLDEPPQTANSPAEPPPFVKLTTLDDQRRASIVEVVLKQQRRLRLRPGFDADMVRQLVRLLEDPSC